MKLYSEQDANPAAVKAAPVAVIGYGSQGRAHALNLKNSGVEVIVGLRKNAPTGAKTALKWRASPMRQRPRR
jgi:ketol-acid reductoisomerase